MPMPRIARADGLSCARTAYFCSPVTSTWATPLIVDNLCASEVSAYSFTFDNGSVGELTIKYTMG